MISSWSERMISHTGTETRSRLLREAAVGNFSAMGRKPDGAMPRGGRGPWVMNFFSRRRKNDGIRGISIG
ncbi:unnamed protein product [Lathyrus oleraceus]